MLTGTVYGWMARQPILRAGQQVSLHISHQRPTLFQGVRKCWHSLVVTFKHSLPLCGLSTPPNPASRVLQCSEHQREAIRRGRSRTPNRGECPQLYPHSQTPFQASGHMLLVMGLNHIQIFLCSFKRTVVTILCMCSLPNLCL